jgi:hypothetical protein
MYEIEMHTYDIYNGIFLGQPTLAPILWLFHSPMPELTIPFTYLEIPLLMIMCEYPSTLVPGQLSTVPPLLLNPPRRHPID